MSLRGLGGLRGGCKDANLVWGLGKTLNFPAHSRWGNLPEDDPDYPNNVRVFMSVAQVRAKVAPTDVYYGSINAGDTPPFDSGFPEMSTGAHLYERPSEGYTEAKWAPTGSEYALRHCLGSRAIYIAGEQRFVDYLVAASAGWGFLRYLVRVDIRSQTAETRDLQSEDLVWDPFTEEYVLAPVNFIAPYTQGLGTVGVPTPTDYGQEKDPYPDRWAVTERYILFSDYAQLGEPLAGEHTVSRWDHATNTLTRCRSIPWGYDIGSPEEGFFPLLLPSRRAFQNDENDQPWWIAGNVVVGYGTGRWTSSDGYFTPAQVEHDLQLPDFSGYDPENPPPEEPLTSTAVVLFYQRMYGKDLVVLADLYSDAAGNHRTFWLYDGTQWRWAGNVLVGQTELSYLTIDDDENFLVGNGLYIHKYNKNWELQWEVNRTPSPPVAPDRDYYDDSGDTADEPSDWYENWTVEDDSDMFPEVNSWVPPTYRRFQILTNKAWVQVRGFRSYVDLATKLVDLEGNDGFRYFFLKHQYGGWSGGPPGKVPASIPCWSFSHDGSIKVPHVQYTRVPPLFNDWTYVNPPPPTYADRREYTNVRPIVRRCYTNFDPTEFDYVSTPAELAGNEYYDDGLMPWLKYFTFMTHWSSTFLPAYFYHAIFTWNEFGPWNKHIDNPANPGDPNDFFSFGVAGSIPTRFDYDFDIVATSCGCGSTAVAY